MEKKLEIFGSYEKGITDSKIIIGHNNTKYIVGGNARYNIRSNIIDWELMKNNSADQKNQINWINSVLKLPKYIDNTDTLCAILQELMSLSHIDFLKFLEKSLNLNEAIIIQLRRLFYIIVQKDTKDMCQIEFCPYEPVKRITQLLDAMNKINTIKIGVDLESFDKIKTIVNDIKNIKKLKDSKIDIIFQEQENDNLSKKIDKFVKIYEAVYPELQQIERDNITVAQKIEDICNIIEDF